MSRLRGIVDKIIDDKIAAIPVKSTTDTALRAQVDALTQAMSSEIAKLKAAHAGINLEPVPVGTIIQSALTQAELNAADNGGVWRLCDGGSAAGTQYATITKRTTVPDLRGAFLRGAGTRAANTAWAGGAVNTHVEDSTKRPNANFTSTVNDPRVDNTGAGGNRGVAGASWSATEAYLHPGTSNPTVNGGGDAETRPKHYTVNYYIRIN